MVYQRKDEHAPRAGRYTNRNLCQGNGFHRTSSSQQGIKLLQFVYPSRQVQIISLWLSKKDLTQAEHFPPAADTTVSMKRLKHSGQLLHCWHIHNSAPRTETQQQTTPLSSTQWNEVKHLQHDAEKLLDSFTSACLQQDKVKKPKDDCSKKHQEEMLWPLCLLLSLHFGFCSSCEHISVQVCTRILLIL